MNCKIKVELKYTGTRKELVKDIAAAIGANAQYLAAPTFAYKVGIYTINRDNTIEWNTDDMTTRVCKPLGALKEAGRFEYIRYWLDDQLVPVSNIETLDIPEEPTVAPHAGDSAPEGINVPETKENPAEAPIRAVYDEKNRDCKVTADKETINKFMALMTQKAELIKKAIPALRINTISRDGETTTLTFDSFWETSSAREAEGNDATPYTMFIERMMEMARTAKRVSAKTNPIANPKYQFRCFLLRLGFIGKEYGPARKVLLSRLEGNSAWLRGSREA